MKLRPTRNNEPVPTYRIINLIFAIIILLIFLYSALYSHKEVNHPIPSVFSEITGSESPSTGLSRAFSALMQCDVKSARELNSYALQIFLFFVFQLVFRTFNFFLTKTNFSWINTYILADITLSILFFLLAFRPLILFTFELFRNFIVN
ncbi:DUF2752 domain-containing protein [Marinifilum sp. JC070]|uniref:DUF2752 domain-containing protein n=1 Tax=Marinifilum caeruleilacunae TaxID=2499076 RepID=A0ABX1X229_9BACT|nr:DUF2752 domain-containing protein [Marinifilum caeruleilacunae]